MKETPTKYLIKGEIVERPGELNSRIFEVISGLLRSYTIDEKGKEHVYMFACEGWTIADNCPEDQPCELYIEALENSEVKVYRKSETQERFLHEFFMRAYALQKRIIQLMSSTALERYQYFVETYPTLLHRVSQKMIASYLGITPEALSKIKSERFKK